jgi:hypothetical protein
MSASLPRVAPAIRHVQDNARNYHKSPRHDKLRMVFGNGGAAEWTPSKLDRSSLTF